MCTTRGSPCMSSEIAYAAIHIPRSPSHRSAPGLRARTCSRSRGYQGDELTLRGVKRSRRRRGMRPSRGGPSLGWRRPVLAHEEQDPATATATAMAIHQGPKRHRRRIAATRTPASRAACSDRTSGDASRRSRISAASRLQGSRRGVPSTAARAKRRHSPGIPLSSRVPRSLNCSPEPPTSRRSCQ